jgi:hypothetical protein
MAEFTVAKQGRLRVATADSTTATTETLVAAGTSVKFISATLGGAAGQLTVKDAGGTNVISLLEIVGATSGTVQDDQSGSPIPANGLSVVTTTSNYTASVVFSLMPTGR